MGTDGGEKARNGASEKRSGGHTTQAGDEFARVLAHDDDTHGGSTTEAGRNAVEAAKSSRGRPKTRAVLTWALASGHRSVLSSRSGRRAHVGTGRP